MEYKISDSKETLDELKKCKPFEGQEKEVKNLGAEIEKLENKLKSLKNSSLKASLSSVKNIEFNPNKINNNNYALNKTNFGNQSIKVQGDLPYIARNMSDLKIETAKVNTEVKNFGKHSSDSFERGLKSLKSFSLSLLGLRSVYSLLNKASSSYLSQDTELAQKLQSIWVGLGSFLVPVIEMISDALLKGLGYLNEFIKALTGVDFIANANAKALKKQASAQKELNNQTYAFDEMNIQQKQSTGTVSSSSGSGLIEIPELDSRIVSKLQDLAYWLKENWYWISKVGIALGVAFGAVKIAGLLSNIGKLIGGTGAGLTGLAGLLGIVAVAWLGSIAIKGIKEAIEQAKLLNEELEKNAEMHEESAKKTSETATTITDMAIQEKKAGKEIDNVTNYLRNQIKYSKQQYDTTKNQMIPMLENFTSTNDTVRKSQHLTAVEIANVNECFKKLYDQGLLNDEQAQDYYDSLCDQIIVMGDLGYDISDLRERYIELTNSDYNITVNAKLHDQVTNDFQSLIRNLSGSTIHLNVDSSRSHGGGGRAFAVGGIVTQPTRALIGEAGYPEAVVPMTADYLSTLAGMIAQYGGGSGNVTIPIYLDSRLMQRYMVDVAKKKAFATNS